MAENAKGKGKTVAKASVREAAVPYETRPVGEVFWMAFRSLSKGQREQIVARLLEDPEFREDLLDIAIAIERENEPSRPYEEFAEELRREGRL